MINLFDFPGVYLIEFPDGINYVGITQKCVGKRRGDHYAHARWGRDTLVAEGLREHGAAAKFRVITSCKDPRTLRVLEMLFIEKYNTLAPFGRNTSPGGTLVSKSSAKKISQALRGRIMGPEWRAKLGRNRKRVRVEGVEYPSITKAADFYGISRVAATYRFKSSRFTGWVCPEIEKEMKGCTGRPRKVCEKHRNVAQGFLTA